MKNWLVVLTASLFCGASSYAGEFPAGGFENSMFESLYENAEAESKTDLGFANSGLNMSCFRLFSLQAMSRGGVGGAGDNTITSSGRISTPHNYLELTPMWGYAFGGDFKDEETGDNLKISDDSVIGFRLAYDYEYNSQIEFSYSHQETELSGGDLFPRDALFDLDVDYYHVGGSLFWDRGSELEPYFTGTLGLTHFIPQESGVDSMVGFSMGFGGGMRYFPLERFGLYTGVRGLVTLVNSDIKIYSGERGTYVKIKADDLWQFQVYAGLIFVF